MRTEYEYISFHKVGSKPKTYIWECRNRNSGAVLGVVEWYGPWHQYCFMPIGLIVLSKGCMMNINSFIEQAMQLQKKGSKDGETS